MKEGSVELKVGLFTIISLVVIGYMFFVLSPDSFQNKNYNSYYTIVKDAGGVVQKTQIKTNGVVVGKIKFVKLQSNETRLDLEVDSSVLVPVGSQVAVKEKGLLGDVFLEIIRAKDSGQYIENGGMIPPLEDQVNISTLIGIVGSVGKDIKKISSTFADVFGGEKGGQNLTQMIADFKSIADETKGILHDNRASIQKMLSQLEESSLIIKNLLTNNKQDFDFIIKDFKKTSHNLAYFSESMREFMTPENKDKLQKIIANFDTTMVEVEKTATNARMITDRLQKGEGSLGRLMTNDTAVVEIESAIKDLRKLLSPAKRLVIDVDYHGELRGDAAAQHFFNVLFRTRPDRYYLLGLTDIYQSTVQTNYEYQQDPTRKDMNGNPLIVQSKETVKERKSLRVNAQFVKRFADISLKFGLFESTGGLGFDYHLFNDKLKFTFEAFDWDNFGTLRKVAHLKAYFSILFYGHFNFIFGADDLTKKSKPNSFIGAGLTFSDDDLKSMFGAASLMH